MADTLAFPWAREYDEDQLAAFIEDLWGAASGDDGLGTLDAIEKAVAAHRPAETQRPCPLSERDVEILTQIANGETYASAGRNLGLSSESVRGRCPQMYARLGAKNAAHAAAIAAHEGWVPGLRIPEPIEEIPRIVRGPHAWNRIYRRIAAELRALPGEQLPLGPYGSRSGARGAASYIRRGLLRSFEPAGAFDASAVRGDGGKWIVLARYVGDASDPNTRSTEGLAP